MVVKQMNKMIQYERIDLSEGIDLDKTDKSKKYVKFVTIGILENWILNLTQKIVTAVTI